jgi:purine-nucleoside phosphorylase
MKSLPASFQLEKYHISPEDVVRMTFHCTAEAIHPDVILMPWWQPDVFGMWVEPIKVVTPGVLFEAQYQGKPLSILRSGIGAPQTGDVVLALGCTPCERIWFAGSIGGLKADMHIGDLAVPSFSYAGDGFCRYLQPGFPGEDTFLERVFPDADLSARVTRAVEPLAQAGGVALYTGAIFCTDSILAEFSRLDEMINRLGCIGIEMETAAVFKAARLVGIRAAALFSVSDVPVRNQSLYAGRPEEEKVRRRETRRKVLAKALLDSIP